MLGRIGIIIKAQFERVNVGLVGYCICTLVVQFSIVAFNFIEVAIGQEVLVKEPAIHLLNGHVKTPEVTVVLCRAEFGRFVNYTIVHPVRLGCLHTHEVERQK